ncbi:MAG TPA: hypothetical protein VEV17_08405 [Bryobacteraceae bacterium]|nr:hypothetical protein [Bryobacteraceae bacterium]
MSWLLAVLLALCASQAVPVARVQPGREACAIVWILQARARTEQRVAVRQIRRSREQPSEPGRPAAPQFPSQPFSSSLYQRPPPSALS